MVEDLEGKHGEVRDMKTGKQDGREADGEDMNGGRVLKDMLEEREKDMDIREHVGGVGR